MEISDTHLPSIPTHCFYGKTYSNIEAAVNALENCEDSADVDLIIVPPDVDDQTDEENVEAGDLFCNQESLPNDIPGQVEIFLPDDIYDEEDNIPLSILKQRQQPKEKFEPNWTNKVLPLRMKGTQGCQDREDIMKLELNGLNPVEVFEKLMDSEVIDMIVEQTNLYSTQKNNHSFFVSSADIKTFIGILLFTGYHQLPRERLYWNLDEDLQVPLVCNSMSRNRYLDIKKYIHLSDNNNLNKSDKMSKLRPFMNILNQKFRQWGIFCEALSIDEAMVGYFGRHSSKQFIKGKPVRFGYKDWMLCSSSGYCFAFDTYCGAKNVTVREMNMPLGSKIVLELLDVLAVPSDHTVFFDNFFSSYDLLALLKKMNIRATGTVRNNRTKKCPLTDQKAFQKKERGYYEVKYDENCQLLFIRWKDNNIVTMATNYDSVTPLAKVKRWSTAAASKIDIPQPGTFQTYNRNMGGVDIMDQCVNNYRIGIRGKKWWWPLFTHMINLTLVNAWRVYQIANEGESLDLLAFQRYIVRHYLRSSVTKKRSCASVPESIRASEGGHFPKKLVNQLRCVICHYRVRWSCCRCNVTLCIERDCFIRYHS